jgi:translation initiation factor eIF-2B subunit epsilon
VVGFFWWVDDQQTQHNTTQSPTKLQPKPLNQKPTKQKQDAPDVSTNAGKLLLVKRLRARLAEWAPLLRRFLKSEDDQVELLLTLEEYCAGEGVFEGAGEPAGPLFSAVFAQLLQQLYDADVVDEPAFEAWAGEKAEADADERVYLEKARPFLDWLATADEDEDEDEEEGSDE